MIPLFYSRSQDGVPPRLDRAHQGVAGDPRSAVQHQPHGARVPRGSLPAQPRTLGTAQRRPRADRQVERVGRPGSAPPGRRCGSRRSKPTRRSGRKSAPAYLSRRAFASDPWHRMTFASSCLPAASTPGRRSCRGNPRRCSTRTPMETTGTPSPEATAARPRDPTATPCGSCRPPRSAKPPGDGAGALGIGTTSSCEAEQVVVTDASGYIVRPAGEEDAWLGSRYVRTMGGRRFCTTGYNP